MEKSHALSFYWTWGVGMGNRHRVKHRKFHLNMNSFTLRERVLEQAAQRGCGVSLSGDI